MRAPSPARGGGLGRGNIDFVVMAGRPGPLPDPPPQAGEGRIHGARLLRCMGLLFEKTNPSSPAQKAATGVKQFTQRRAGAAYLSFGLQRRRSRRRCAEW